MNEKESDFNSVDEYILMCPENIHGIIKSIRETILKAAPEATEKISYQMPCYYLNGNLVYFGVFKKHIGFYPTPSAIEAFREQLSGYKYTKGGIQFPFNEPMPLDLIFRMVQFRVGENLTTTQKKSSKKSKE